MRFLLLALCLSSCTRVNPCASLYAEASKLDTKAKLLISQGDREALVAFEQYLDAINKAFKCSGEVTGSGK